MKDSQRTRFGNQLVVKYIKVNNERFSTSGGCGARRS